MHSLIRGRSTRGTAREAVQLRRSLSADVVRNSVAISRDSFLELIATLESILIGGLVRSLIGNDCRTVASKRQSLRRLRQGQSHWPGRHVLDVGSMSSVGRVGLMNLTGGIVLDGRLSVIARKIVEVQGIACCGRERDLTSREQVGSVDLRAKHRHRRLSSANLQSGRHERILSIRSKGIGAVVYLDQVELGRRSKVIHGTWSKVARLRHETTGTDTLSLGGIAAGTDIITSQINDFLAALVVEQATNVLADRGLDAQIAHGGAAGKLAVVRLAGHLRERNAIVVLDWSAQVGNCTVRARSKVLSGNR